MIEEPLRPSRLWYVLALAILVAGAGLYAFVARDLFVSMFSGVGPDASREPGEAHPMFSDHWSWMVDAWVAAGIMLLAKGTAITIAIVVFFKRQAAKQRLEGERALRGR